MTNEEFDHIIHVKLKGFTTEVPEDLWERISISTVENTDNTFDHIFQDKFRDLQWPVSADLFDKIITEEKNKRIFFILPKISKIAASLILIVLVSTVSAFLYFKNKPFEINQTSDSSSYSKTPSLPSKKDNSSIEDEYQLPNNTNSNNRNQFINESVKEQQSTSINKDKQSNNEAANSFRKSPLAKINSLASNSVKSNFQLNPINNEEGISQKSSNANQPFTKLNAETINIDRGTSLGQSGDKEINYLFNHSRNIRNVVICPSDKKMRNTNWDLEMFVSPTDFAFKTVTNNTASQDFLNRKDSSEKMKLGYSTSFRIVKPITDNFSIKTGLQFTQANEQFTYRTENEIKTTTVVTVRNITLANGTTVTVSDTSILQQIGYKTNSVNNSYKTIDVPLLLGYEFGNEDWRFGINTGVLFNLSSLNKGVTLDTSLLPLSFSKESNLMYKNNIGLGLYAGISITKRINYNTLIFAEPYIRYNLSNMTTAQSTFNQKFTIGGLALGVRFNLNNR